MALIKCPECGKEISDKAAACIHCGCPLEPKANNSQPTVLANNENFASTKTYEEINPEDGHKSKLKFYQSNWFIFPMLLVFFPVGVFLLWKYKKSNLFVRIISSIVFLIVFLFCILLLIAPLLPCEHEWIEATCTTSKYCNICGEIEGVAAGHIEGEWILIEDATLSDDGKEKTVCTVCGTTLNSRKIERKEAEVLDSTFNFTDDELIDWANSWLNDTYKIDDSGTFDLGSDILGYRVKSDDGEDGMLLLKHDGGDEVSAIMVYFDDFVDRTALALFFGAKIHSSFDYEDASLVLANNSTYLAANMVATSLTIEDGLEVALLTPETYMYKIISGTSLTLSDGYVFIERDTGEYTKYDNNIWEYIINTYGDDYSQWFWHDDSGDDTDGGIGEVKTYRGIVLAESTKADVIAAYGRSDIEKIFDKDSDILYLSMKSSGVSDYQYLEDTKNVLVYDYDGQFQLVFYIDNADVVDFILYTSGVWYE